MVTVILCIQILHLLQQQDLKNQYSMDYVPMVLLDEHYYMPCVTPILHVLEVWEEDSNHL